VERVTARERLADALERAGCRPSSTGAARCPAHEDRSPSMSFQLGTDVQGVVVKCHAGCTPAEIVEALGLRLSDLFDRPRTASAQPCRPRAVAEYIYTDEHGEVLFHTVRMEPGHGGARKSFRQKRPNGRGGWVWNVQGVRRVLYRLPEVVAAVQEARPVHVVEGEKDADRLVALGLVATCNPMGAGKWRPEHADALKGAKVVVIRDRDAPGKAHAADIVRSVDGLAASVQLLEPASGKDVSDHLDAGLSLEALRPVQDAEAPTSAEPPPLDDDTRAVADLYPPLDWHELWNAARSEPEWLCQPLLEAGRVVALFSPAKTGKSLLTLEIAAALAAGRPVLDNPAQHPMRVLYVDLETALTTFANA